MGDTGGATGTADAVDGVNALVVIYDRNGGYVTGGGWLDSPPRALLSNPTLSGEPSFGFVSKYFKNATSPKGETGFDFLLAGFKFNALNFDPSLTGAAPRSRRSSCVQAHTGRGLDLLRDACGAAPARARPRWVVLGEELVHLEADEE